MSLLAAFVLALGSCADDDGNSSSGDVATDVCSAFSLRCEGSQLQICENDAWIKKEDCTNGCDSATKQCKDSETVDPPVANLCTASELRCEGNELQVCQDNAWVKKEDCANGCDSDTKKCKDSETVDPPVVNLCTASELRCEGNELQVCQDNAWVKKEDCANGCDSAAKTCKTADNPGTGNVICDEGDAKCDGDYIVSCIQDKWKRADTACEFGCKKGTCKTQSTEPPKASDLVTCDDYGCYSDADNQTCTDKCKAAGQGFCYFDLVDDAYFCSITKQEATGSLSSVYPPDKLVSCDATKCQESSTHKSCSDFCKGRSANYCYVDISENKFYCVGVELPATGKIEEPSAETYEPEDLVACDDFQCMDQDGGGTCSETCKTKGQNYCYVVLSKNIYTCSSTQLEATGKKPDTPPAATFAPEDLVDCDDGFCKTTEGYCSDVCKAQGHNYCYLILSQENTYSCFDTQMEATGKVYPASDLAVCTEGNCNTGTQTCSQMCQADGRSYCYVILSQPNTFGCSTKQQEATGSK